MPGYFKVVVHLLLILIAFQIFNLNTAACVASPDGSVTVNHTLSYVAKAYWASSFHKEKHKDQTGKGTYHHHKLWKKFFSEKVGVVPQGEPYTFTSSDQEVLYFPNYLGYEFLYFKSINPPPPKA